MMDKIYWPSWRFGPNGAAEVFQSESEVPAGWVDHPSKVVDEPEPVVETATEVKRRGRPPKVQEKDF
jgi:hypothetical protein